MAQPDLNELDLDVRGAMERIARAEPTRILGIRAGDQKNFFAAVRTEAERLRRAVRIIAAALQEQPLKTELLAEECLRRISGRNEWSEAELEQLHEYAKGIDFDSFPFDLCRVTLRLNNLAEVETVGSGRTVELVDFDLEWGRTYLSYMDKLFISTRVAPAVDAVLAGTRSEAILRKKEADLPPEDESEFFEDGMMDPEWDKWVSLGNDEEGGERFQPYFESEENILRARRMEEKALPWLQRYIGIMEKERRAGSGRLKGVKKVAEIEVTGKYLDRNFYCLNLEEFSDIYIMTDLHASREALKKALRATGYFTRKDRRSLWIFLGDYVDRGRMDFWVLYHLIKLKVLNPDQVLLLRGNHEHYDIVDGRIECHFKPDDFFEFMHTLIFATQEPAFSQELKELVLKDFCSGLPLGVFIKGGRNLFVAHSGFIYPKVEIDIRELMRHDDDYFRLRIDRFPNTNCLEDLNDPENIQALVWAEATTAKYRTAVYERRKEICLYTQDNFMDKFGFDAVIRGHDHPQSGLECIVDGQLVNREGILRTNGQNPAAEAAIAEFDRGGGAGIGHQPEDPNRAVPKVITFFSSGGNEDLFDYRTYHAGVLRLNTGGIRWISLNGGEHGTECNPE